MRDVCGTAAAGTSGGRSSATHGGNVVVGVECDNGFPVLSPCTDNDADACAGHVTRAYVFGHCSPGSASRTMRFRMLSDVW